MQLNTVSIWHLETKMGTYTTNYNLFMPSIGEQGWGDLVNGNFTTIDTTMKSLSNHIVTLETETDARLATLEAGEFDSADIETLYVKNIVMPTLSYNGTFTITVGAGSTTTIPLFSSPFPISGKVAVQMSDTTNSSCTITVFTPSGFQSIWGTTTSLNEYTVTDAYSVQILCRNDNHYASGKTITYTIGKVAYT